MTSDVRAKTIFRAAQLSERLMVIGHDSCYFTLLSLNVRMTERECEEKHREGREKRHSEKKNTESKRDVERSEKNETEGERKLWLSVTTTSSSCTENTNQTLQETKKDSGGEDMAINVTVISSLLTVGCRDQNGQNGLLF